MLVKLVFIVGALFLATAAVAGEPPGECTVPSQRLDCGSLTCDSFTHRCAACNRSSDCWDHGMTCLEGRCELRPLLKSTWWQPTVTCISVVLICAIAAVAGVGGGGLLVPLYAMVLGMPLMNAVALSQATISGQALLNVWVKLRQRHPIHDRPIINYELLSLWLPPSLAGTILGNLAGMVVPDWLRIGSLFGVLLYVLFRVVRKALEQKKKDQQAQAMKEAEESANPPVAEAGTAPAVLVPAAAATGATPDDEAMSTPPQEDPAETDAPKRPEGETAAVVGVDFFSLNASKPVMRPEVPPETDSPDENSPLTAASGPGFGTPRRDSQLSHKSHHAAGRERPPSKKQYDIRNFAFIAAIFLPLLAANVVRAGWGLVPCGGWLYWLLVGGSLAYLVGVAMWVRHRHGETHQAILSGKLIDVMAYEFNPTTTILYPAVALIAGAAASLLGIGGGLILSALFLEAGCIPQEVSATGATATLFVALMSCLQYIAQHKVPYDFGGLLFGSGVVSTLVGTYGFVKVIEARGWRFLYVVALAIILGGSLLFLLSAGIFNTIEELRHHGNLGFGEICPTIVVPPKMP